MGKALFVMDMPDSCEKCPLFFGFYSDMVCRANGNTINYPYPEKHRQEWCPLKPMPEKKIVEDVPFNNDFDIGWNACIDKILEGEKK